MDKEDICFVLMPFEEPFETYYKNIIEPVINDKGLEPLRAKNMRTSTSYLEYIRTNIEGAKILIADLSAKTQNVPDEVGYAHASNKQVILIKRTKDPLPSNFSGLSYLPYDPDEEKWEDKLRDELGEYIDETLKLAAAAEERKKAETRDFSLHLEEYNTQRYLLKVEKESPFRYMAKNRFSVLTYTRHIVRERRKQLKPEDEDYEKYLKNRIINFINKENINYTDIIYEGGVKKYLAGSESMGILTIHDRRARFKHILRIIFLLKRKKGYKMIVLNKKLALNFIVYKNLVMLASPLLEPDLGVRSVVLKGQYAQDKFEDQFNKTQRTQRTQKRLHSSYK